MGISNVLALVALVLEVVHYAVSHDATLAFIALVVLTLAVILSGGFFGFVTRGRTV